MILPKAQSAAGGASTDVQEAAITSHRKLDFKTCSWLPVQLSGNAPESSGSRLQGSTKLVD